MTIQDAIKMVIAGKNLTISEASSAFTAIMEGQASDSQIAAFIVGLRMKGETVEEITGAASVMRDKAVPIKPREGENLIDTCGTGGDGANTFNISTATAIVAAGAGAKVAKHGNRSVSSRSGSADVLEALGVNVNLSADQIGHCIEETGIGFLFAPMLHKAMKYATAPRKEIGIRTVFNVLGPLTNPAAAPNQLMGVFAAHLTEIMAEVLKNLGTRKAFVVHGLDSIDEVSLCNATQISEIRNGQIHTYTVEPEMYGLKKVDPKEITGGEPKKNAEIINDLLGGKKGPGRDIVLLNAAFALCAASIAEDPAEGIKMAREAVDSGAAKSKLKQLVEFTRDLENC
ncbi:MAG: anthranilate phosphoribosyltransferase [Chitinispirillaceae bacterium]